VGRFKGNDEEVGGCGWLCVHRTKYIKRETKEEAVLGEANID
jgi:hypothetical protein